LFLLCLIPVIQACAPRSIREAQLVVAEADSLWYNGKIYGFDYGDSATLAQAYATLSRLPFPLILGEGWGDVYAHACYHYGRLLRKKDNPADAMQAFINATHSRTRDYHILGRVYSNMGSICHLAGEYALAYDMYERSAGMFLKNRDTINYYYALNDMAFELAEQGMKDETFAILKKIEEKSTDFEMLIKIYETKAVLFRTIGQNDSAIYYADKMQHDGVIYPSGIIIKAQAYDNLGQKNSALSLAKQILADSSSSYQDKFNALYIIQHCDSSLCPKNISELASQREDIRYYEYEPQREKLLQAVQLLEQDLHKRIEWFKWVLIIMLILCGIGTIVLSKNWLAQKHHTYTMLKELANERADNRKESIKNHIEGRDFRQVLHWNNYSAMKNDVNLYMGGLIQKLEPYNLNEVQVRFCVLTLMNLSLRRIAKELNYSYPSAIKTLKKRTSDKLGTRPQELKEFLFRL